MLMTFVGQTVAVQYISIVNDIPDLHDKSQLVNVVNDSSNTAKIADSALEEEDCNEVACCEVDCCESECICPANTCASIVYVDSELALSTVIILRGASQPFAAKSKQSTSSSLFRPPIFTS